MTPASTSPKIWIVESYGTELFPWKEDVEARPLPGDHWVNVDV
jgi:hypothetical protein